MEHEIVRQTKSTEIGDLIKALVKVQANLEPTVKDSENPFLKNKYSNLRACWDAAKDLLAANGLAVVQTFGGTADQPSVITLLGHESGQWIEGEMKLNPGKGANPCQQAGAAGTYGRRYGFCAAVGLYQEDLDAADTTGKKGGGKKEETTTSNRPPAKTPDGTVGKAVTTAQIKRFHAIKRDKGWDDKQAKQLIKDFGYSSTTEIEGWEAYGKICKILEAGPEAYQQKREAEEK